MLLQSLVGSHMNFDGDLCPKTKHMVPRGPFMKVKGKSPTRGVFMKVEGKRILDLKAKLLEG